MLAYVNSFSLSDKRLKRKEKWLQKVFIRVIDEIVGLALTYPHVQ